MKHSYISSKFKTFIYIIEISHALSWAILLIRQLSSANQIAIDFWQCYIMRRYESNRFEINQTKDFCKLKRPMRLKISLDSLTFSGISQRKRKAQQKNQKWTMKNWNDLWARKLLFLSMISIALVFFDFFLWFEILKWIYLSLIRLNALQCPSIMHGTFFCSKFEMNNVNNRKVDASLLD